MTSVLTAVAMMAVIGCQNAEVDDSLPTRPAYAFLGKVDPSFVGDWIGSDKMSGLNLKDDGTAEILAATMSVSGRAENTLKGEWRVDKSNLYLRYRASGSEVTLKYDARLKGTALELIQAGNNHKNLYRRK